MRPRRRLDYVVYDHILAGSETDFDVLAEHASSLIKIELPKTLEPISVPIFKVIKKLPHEELAEEFPCWLSVTQECYIKEEEKKA